MSLVLSFDTDDPQFRRGVEIGMLWERLVHECPVSGTVHADCAEMVMRMAEARGLRFSAESLGNDWLDVTVGAES